MKNHPANSTQNSFTTVSQVPELSKAQALQYIKKVLLQECCDPQKVDFVLWKLAKSKAVLTIEVGDIKQAFGDINFNYLQDL